jgi:hypothetical protein
MLPSRAGLKSTAEYAARSKEGVVAALRDARAARLVVPPREAHAHRFFFGLAVPLTLLRIAWNDAPTRASMRRRLIPPLLCVALAAVIGVVSTVSDLKEKQALSFKKPGLTVTLPPSGDDDDDDDDSPAIELPAVAKAALVRAAPPPRPRRSPLRSLLDLATSRIAKLVAALGVVEWILIWIGREHHDAMAYEVAVLTGVPGERPAGPPRLRFDFGWLWLKTWRAIRFLLFLTLVSPFAWLLGHVPVVGPSLAIAAEAVWGAYWASVFAIANTFVAWEARPPSPPPWFIRILARAGTIPVVGIPVRLYAHLLTFATRKVWPACMAFENAPWESAGLALARGVASIPFLYLVLRPLFAPAATHALLGRGLTNTSWEQS